MLTKNKAGPESEGTSTSFIQCGEKFIVPHSMRKIVDSLPLLERARLDSLKEPPSGSAFKEEGGSTSKKAEVAF